MPKDFGLDEVLFTTLRAFIMQLQASQTQSGESGEKWQPLKDICPGLFEEEEVAEETPDTTQDVRDKINKAEQKERKAQAAKAKLQEKQKKSRRSLRKSERSWPRRKKTSARQTPTWSNGAVSSPDLQRKKAAARACTLTTTQTYGKTLSLWTPKGPRAGGKVCWKKGGGAKA